MGEVGSYFNPFSSLHDHAIQKFAELGFLSKMSIILATVLATPFFLVGGMAAFRATTERCWNSKHKKDKGFPADVTLKNVAEFSRNYFLESRKNKEEESDLNKFILLADECLEKLENKKQEGRQIQWGLLIVNVRNILENDSKADVAKYELAIKKFREECELDFKNKGVVSEETKTKTESECKSDLNEFILLADEYLEKLENKQQEGRRIQCGLLIVTVRNILKNDSEADVAKYELAIKKFKEECKLDFKNKEKGFVEKHKIYGEAIEEVLKNDSILEEKIFNRVTSAYEEMKNEFDKINESEKWVERIKYQNLKRTMEEATNKMNLICRKNLEKK